MDNQNLKYLLTLPPEEIIKWYKSKGYRFSWDWKDTWKQSHARAFTVAKMMKLDLLQETKREVDKIFTDGITYEEFRKQLTPILKRNGWWGKVLASEVPGFDPKTGGDPNKVVQLGSPRRLRTIYQTNANVAYSAGNYNFLIQNVNSRPYWKYNQIDRERKRKDHAKYDEKIFRWDDPIWKKIFPPNGFSCGCFVTAHTENEVKRNRWNISKGEDFTVNVAEGWDYNPAAAYPAWGMDTAYKVVDNQKTFADFGRPKVRNVPMEQRLLAPEKFPRIEEVGKEKLTDLIKKEFGLEEKSWNLFPTADGDQALFTDNVFHVLDKADGREQYIPYIKKTLRNPFEVYLTEYEDVNKPKHRELRKTYIGLFKNQTGKEDLFMVLRMIGDSSIFWNAFPRGRGKIDQMRTGELIVGK
ncbi:MAG: phage head morphogenesis protein [Melioribacteraceae bacterium]|nr:phage head morphogenesis protein [Melioribacteraceae bacterium]MCF8414545.1 phage head morphogenesis protein [Melioribacteraceae bacterium]